MGEKSVRLRVSDILDAIEGIQAALAGVDFEGYASSWTLRRSTERGLEIISEASRHIPETLKAQTPGIPWPQIASIGNLLRHEYERVEDRIVWNVVTEHLDSLADATRAMLASLGEDASA